jgi:tetratricopeptide (TPR) repeat protein
MLLLAACAGTPRVSNAVNREDAGTPPVVSNLVSLTDAIAGAAASVEEKAPAGGAVAVVKINSPLTALSDFLAGELENRFTTAETLTVLARGEHLAGVNAEQQFQMSGMVSDESAAGIGRFLGAQVVITGDFTRFTNFSQLALRAVEVETARLLTAYTAKVAPDDPVLAGITAPLGPATGWAVSEADLEQLNLAKDYIAAGIFDIAIEELNRLIAKNRNFAEAWYQRGEVYRNNKLENDRALADLTEAIRLDPNNAGYYISRGRMYGSDDRAIADFTRAIRLDPHNADAYSDRGFVYYFHKKDYYRAIADYTEVIRLDSTEKLHYAYKSRGDSYAARGSAPYAGKGDYDQAIADYTEAIRLGPPGSDWNWVRSTLYRSRAQMYAELSQYDWAIADCTEAIRLIPTGSDWLLTMVYQSRAEIYEKLFQTDRAIADYTEAARLNPNQEYTLFWRAEAYLDNGDYDQAIAYYTAFLRIKPDDANSYNERGLAYYHKKDYDWAVADYSQAIRIDPTQFVFHNNRGNAYYHKKDYDRAIADYEAALRIYPGFAQARTGLENARRRGR